MQDAEGELIVRLREAVKIRLKAEVPLGAFLSGGVDSSAIVAMMAGLMKDPVNTCSIAFQEKAFDESQYAEQVARQYKTEHHHRNRRHRRLRAARHAGRPVRRAVRRQFGDPDLPRLPAGAQARDGGAVGRRRRREPGRLPPLPLRHGRRQRALEDPVRPAQAGVRPARQILSEGRLGAARVPRQDHLRSAVARPGRRLLPRRLDHVRRHARAAVLRQVPQEPARLPGDRGDEGPRRQFADRRSAVDDPVPRHEDLPAGRHPDQGRPRQHGARARSARAAARPQAGRVDLRPAAGDEAERQRRQVHLQEGARTAT